MDARSSFGDRDASLVRQLAAAFGCDEATVMHTALLCLSGVFLEHHHHGHGVAIEALRPNLIRRGNQLCSNKHIESVADAYRASSRGEGLPPPPIVVSNGALVDGNHRLRAALGMGLARIPAFVYYAKRGNGRPPKDELEQLRDRLLKLRPAAAKRLGLLR